MRRRGFTLVELLVSITIIAILSGIMLVALTIGRGAALRARTTVTITNLQNIIAPLHASYRARRMPRSFAAVKFGHIQGIHLNLLRDTMRMELPQCWDDVREPPLQFDCRLADGTIGTYQLPGPPMRAAVAGRRLANASQAADAKYGAGPLFGEGPERIERHASAECLYLIVILADPENRGRFQNDEVGDVDGDGLLEFLDGWGNPIYFLRWAPGVVDSDVQPVVTALAGGVAVFRSDWAVKAVEEDYDPFDGQPADKSLNGFPADAVLGIKPGYPPRSWRLVPYIYSAGRDHVYDIQNTSPLPICGNPYYFVDTTLNRRVVNLAGAPLDGTNYLTNPPEAPDGEMGHYDNIHSHLSLTGR